MTVKKPAQEANHFGPPDKYLFHLGVGDEVEVPVPVAVLLVLEGIENLALFLLEVGQWPKRFGQQLQGLRFHRNLAGPGAEYPPLHAQDVPQVDALEQLRIHLRPHQVNLDIDLLFTGVVLQVGEAGLTHEPQGHDPAGHRCIGGELPVLQALQVGAAVGHLEPIGVGVDSPGAQLVQLLLADVPDFFEGTPGPCHDAVCSGDVPLAAPCPAPGRPPACAAFCSRNARMNRSISPSMTA